MGPLLQELGVTTALLVFACKDVLFQRKICHSGLMTYGKVYICMYV